MKTMNGILVPALLLLATAPAMGEADPRARVPVVALADRFEHRAFKLLDEALSEHRYPTRLQAAGLEAFQDLAWVAGYFSDRARVRPRGRGSVEDFEILAEAFFRAGEWMNRVPWHRDVHRDFQKLQESFRDLDLHYGVNGRGYARGRWRRMDEDRYHQVLRTRVAPRVYRSPRNGPARSGILLDVGLRFPNGSVRVVWR